MVTLRYKEPRHEQRNPFTLTRRQIAARKRAAEQARINQAAKEWLSGRKSSPTPVADRLIAKWAAAELATQAQKPAKPRRRRKPVPLTREQAIVQAYEERDAAIDTLKHLGNRCCHILPRERALRDLNAATDELL